MLYYIERADLKTEFKKEKEQIEERHNLEMKNISLECELKIRQAREYIESREEILMKMDDKKLLADIMICCLLKWKLS